MSILSLMFLSYIIYISVVNDLQRRIYEHKNGLIKTAFPKKDRTDIEK